MKDIHTINAKTINVKFAVYVVMRTLLTEAFCASEDGKTLARRMVDFCTVENNIEPEKITAFLQSECDRIDPIHRLGGGAAGDK